MLQYIYVYIEIGIWTILTLRIGISGESSSFLAFSLMGFSDISRWGPASSRSIWRLPVPSGFRIKARLGAEIYEALEPSWIPAMTMFCIPTENSHS